MVFKQAMASLNLLVRLSLVWVQLTFWHRDLRYDRRTPSVWNNGYFSLLTVNKHAVWKKPLHNLLWSATTATFSSKGHITLLILGFQSTETWRKCSLWVLKAYCNSWIVYFLIGGLNISRAVNQNSPTFKGKQNSLAPRETTIWLSTLTW